jgi:hypothetical protein
MPEISVELSEDEWSAAKKASGATSEAEAVKRILKDFAFRNNMVGAQAVKKKRLSSWGKGMAVYLTREARCMKISAGTRVAVAAVAAAEGHDACIRIMKLHESA